LDKNYPNDYIQSILKEWLLNKNGKIFLALSNNELVGLSHVYFQNNKVAWFEAARVKQNLKGKGIGTLLNLEGIKFCKENGISKARLVTSASNIIAQKQLAKTPFRQLTRWIEWKYDNNLFSISNYENEEEFDHNEIYEHLNKLSCFEESGKLYFDSYVWFDLEKEWLKKVCDEKLVYFDTSNFIVVDKMSRFTNSMQTCYLDCHDEKPDKVFSFLAKKVASFKEKMNYFALFSHKCNYTMKLLLNFGLKVQEEFIIYEANLQS